MRTLPLIALLALLALAVGLPSVRADSHAADDDDGLLGAAAAAAQESTDAAAAGEESIELVPFSAYEFFNGEWEIYRHVLTRSRGVSYASSLPVVRWRLQKENNTANLVGSAVVNGTLGGFDADESLALRFELHDAASGRLQSGPDEDHLRTLAPLAFEHVKGSMPLSAGAWHGADVAGDNDARYLLQVSSNDRWTLTIFPSGGRTLAQVAKAAAPASAARTAAADDDDDNVATGPASTGHPAASSADDLADGAGFVYVAHRIHKDEPKTLFQRYGTMLLLGGMLLVNIWMRSKTGNSQLAAARATAATQGVGPAAARRAAAQPAASGARIEEITEGNSIELPKKTK